jgi:hypothetical protein
MRNLASTGGRYPGSFAEARIYALIGMVAMIRKIWSSLAILFGLAIIVATISYIIIGIKHPTSANSIAIALLSAIGVPVALSAITVGYRGFLRPNAAMLKNEAEAKLRAAAALEDAETAEKIKSDLEAYVAVRTWHLEIERKRQELSRTVETVLEMLEELNQNETRLDIEQTKLNPATVETLDSLLRPDTTSDVLDVFFSTRKTPSPSSQIAEILVRQSYEYMQRRRMRRIARLAPEALSSQNEDNRSTADG